MGQARAPLLVQVLAAGEVGQLLRSAQPFGPDLPDHLGVEPALEDLVFRVLQEVGQGGGDDHLAVAGQGLDTGRQRRVRPFRTDHPPGDVFVEVPVVGHRGQQGAVVGGRLRVLGDLVVEAGGGPLRAVVQDGRQRRAQEQHRRGQPHAHRGEQGAQHALPSARHGQAEPDPEIVQCGGPGFPVRPLGMLAAAHRVPPRSRVRPSRTITSRSA